MRSVKAVHSAFKVNMGGMLLDQALPSGSLEQIDPFLLLHHAKRNIPAGEHQRDQGVGPHPHRGFSPVTFVLEGEVLHQDSRGNKSLIGKNGVQWMNAGMGIIHSERPGVNFLKKGGYFEIVQIWINSPAKHKMDQPEYFSVPEENQASIKMGSSSELKLVSGEYQGVRRNVKSKSELLVGVLNLNKDDIIKLDLPTEFNAGIYVVDGGIKSNGKRAFTKDLMHFNTDGDQIELSVSATTKALLLAGKPLNEPVQSQGPFVMNNGTEILEAMRDYQLGKMGFLVEELQ
ncbi:pirin family protein [bacterium]|nr:pirin family protein [bacterium]